MSIWLEIVSIGPFVVDLGSSARSSEARRCELRLNSTFSYNDLVLGLWLFCSHSSNHNYNFFTIHQLPGTRRISLYIFIQTPTTDLLTGRDCRDVCATKQGAVSGTLSSRRGRGHHGLYRLHVIKGCLKESSPILIHANKKRMGLYSEQLVF